MTLKNKKTICIAGKNQIACDFLTWAISNFPDAGEYVVLCNRDDRGKHLWQPSLRFTSSQLGCREITLAEAYTIDNLVFVSLEFDRIVNPSRFSSAYLYNVHFSELPKYRGVATSVWPIFFGESTSGVTLHEIDAGIDTGNIISQKVFPLNDEWNARELYFQYTKHAMELICAEYTNLLHSEIKSSAQEAKHASYYGRKELDFQNPPLNFTKTAWQVHNAIRAFSFHEYQRPTHPTAGTILKSKISNRCSNRAPGDFNFTTRWTGQLATLDFDLDLQLSPYDAIYRWCANAEETPEELSEALTIINLDQTDSNGWSPLMIASYHGNFDACTRLLEHGADPNKVNLRGTTPLMYAKDFFIGSNEASVFSLLLSRNANADLTDVHGKTIFDYIPQSDQGKKLISIINKQISNAL